MNLGADFEKSLAFVLELEGRFTCDPDDNGCPTNRGITQSEYTDWLRRKHLPLRSMQQILMSDVRRIYWEDYWQEGRCDRMPWPLSLAHFDACVNVGCGQAAKFLQRALDVKDDGAIGPVTLRGLREALERETPVALTEKVVRQRGPFYRQLAANEVRQKRFLKGWLARVEKLTTTLGIA